MRSKISEKDKSFAVARILSKRSTAEEEAKKLKVSAQAVRAWVREQRVQPDPPTPESVSPSLQGSGGPQGPPGSSPPTAPGAEPPPEDPLARARAAAGISAGGGAAAPPPPLPTSEQLKAADQADRELVIQTALDMKKGVVTFVGTKAGLSPEDPGIEKISGLTPLTATALQANAGWIAPIIREKVQGKLALVIALGIEAALTLAALKELLKARGLVKDKEKKDEPEKAEAPK